MSLNFAFDGNKENLNQLINHKRCATNSLFVSSLLCSVGPIRNQVDILKISQRVSWTISKLKTLERAKSQKLGKTLAELKIF